MDKNNIKEKRVEDGLLGFAVGDALGVPVEFVERSTLESKPVKDMLEYGTHNQPKGTWSDDTSMTIATMDSIIEIKKIDYEKMANNFLLWMTNKKYNPHGYLFDIGLTTSKALRKYLIERGAAQKAGSTNYYDNGNGSLMRMLPLVYYFDNYELPDREMATIINNVSSITHGHPISCLGCYLYVKYAMNILEGQDFNQAYRSLQQVDVSMYDEDTVKFYSRVLDGHLSEIADSSLIKSSGFIVDTLEAAIWCNLQNSNYKDAVLQAINLGNDTDTIGALTGGLAGIMYGSESIPKEWLDSLAQKDYLQELSKNYQKTIFENKIKIKK